MLEFQYQYDIATQFQNIAMEVDTPFAVSVETTSSLERHSLCALPLMDAVLSGSEYKIQVT